MTLTMTLTETEIKNIQNATVLFYWMPEEEDRRYPLGVERHKNNVILRGLDLNELHEDIGPENIKIPGYTLHAVESYKEDGEHKADVIMRRIEK